MSNFPVSTNFDLGCETRKPLILDFFCGLKNADNFVHGGATATLVDLIGSAVISRVSVEIIVLKFSLT